MSQPFNDISSLPDPHEPDPYLPMGDEDLPELLPTTRRLTREGFVLGMICLALAAVLLFLRLGRREVFSDEFFTLQAITEGVTDDFLGSVFFGHLPLYYWIMQGWHQAVGVVEAGRETLLRLPSAFFALLTCVGFFFHARRYLRGLTFAVAMLLVALNPILVASGHDATPFALLALFVVLTHHYGVRALDEGGARTWGPYAVLAVVGALIHPFFWFLLIAQFLFALARPRRTPKPFYAVAIVGVALGIVAAMAAVYYSESYFPKRLDVRPPAIDDLIKGLVALTLGDFPRHGANSFFRALMYLLFLVGLGLSVSYYKVRSIEASAMPEGVGWIDQTQDVVGTWRRLSLSSFLAYQWVTFLVPAAAALFLGTFAPRYDLDPEQLLVCLPGLAVLIATGIDFAPGRGGKLTMALLFVVIMAYYDLRVLMFQGYGVRHALKLIENEDYEKGRDLLVYSDPGDIRRTVERYLAPLEPLPLPAPDTPEEAAATEELTAGLAAGKQKVFAIYHEDRVELHKRKYAPVRDALRPAKGWKNTEKWTLSPEEDSELRIYERQP